MAQKTMKQVLSEVLRRLMLERGLNETTLGRLAGVAPNTIGNYCDPTPAVTAKGKERSAKLAEVERIARALKVHPLALLMDASDAASIAKVLADTLAAGSPSGEIGTEPPKRKLAHRNAA